MSARADRFRDAAGTMAHALRRVTCLAIDLVYTNSTDCADVVVEKTLQRDEIAALRDACNAYLDATAPAAALAAE